MKHHLLSAALIALAIVLFISGISFIGTSSIGALLILAAAVCEFHFWKRSLSHRRSDPARR